jgi:hypothetical protein
MKATGEHWGRQSIPSSKEYRLCISESFEITDHLPGYKIILGAVKSHDIILISKLAGF